MGNKGKNKKMETTTSLQLYRSYKREPVLHPDLTTNQLRVLGRMWGFRPRVKGF